MSCAMTYTKLDYKTRTIGTSGVQTQIAHPAESVRYRWLHTKLAVGRCGDTRGIDRVVMLMVTISIVFRAASRRRHFHTGCVVHREPHAHGRCTSPRMYSLGRRARGNLGFKKPKNFQNLLK
jgi:hypothetical protein